MPINKNWHYSENNFHVVPHGERHDTDETCDGAEYKYICLTHALSLGTSCGIARILISPSPSVNILFWESYRKVILPVSLS